MRTHLPGRYDLTNKNDLTIHNIEQESEKLKSVRVDHSSAKHINYFVRIQFLLFISIYRNHFFLNLSKCDSCGKKLQFDMIIKLISIIVLIQAARCKPQVSVIF